MAAILVSIIGGIVDWRTKKIFNVITFPAAIIAIALNVYLNQMQGLWLGVTGWLVGAAIMVLAKGLPFGKYDLDKIGFGDVKLVAAVGAFVGPGMVLLVFFYFSLAYGLISAVRFFGSIPWKDLYLLFMKSQTGVTGDTPPLNVEKLQKTMKTPISIGPAIAVGTLLAILLEKPTLQFMGFQ